MGPARLPIPLIEGRGVSSRPGDAFTDGGSSRERAMGQMEHTRCRQRRAQPNLKLSGSRSC